MNAATLNRRAGAAAASVSRTLASNGLRPLPSGTSRNREGIRVTRTTAERIRVGIDLDSPRARAVVEDEVVNVLRAEGFSVEVQVAALYVSHPRLAP